jgi:uncharacterized protein YaeQ
MSGKFSFTIASEDKKRDLPGKIIIGQQAPETITHVVLKFLGFLLFYRERMQIETNLHIDSIPYVPDLAQLDYELRPALWIECGECNVNKLHKLAVKIPDAEIWIVKKSQAAAEEMFRQMAKADLRRDRYGLIGFDGEMFDEVCSLMRSRNEVFWLGGEFDPGNVQFEFNGLWFDAPVNVLKF